MQCNCNQLRTLQHATYHFWLQTYGARRPGKFTAVILSCIKMPLLRWASNAAHPDIDSVKVSELNPYYQRHWGGIDDVNSLCWDIRGDASRGWSQRNFPVVLISKAQEETPAAFPVRAVSLKSRLSIHTVVSLCVKMILKWCHCINTGNSFSFFSSFPSLFLLSLIKIGCLK